MATALVDPLRQPTREPSLVMSNSHPRMSPGCATSPWLVRAFLPDADHVACGVAEDGDGQAAFQVGQGDDRRTMFGRRAEHLIESGDVDVGPDSGFPGGGQVGAPVSDGIVISSS